MAVLLIDDDVSLCEQLAVYLRAEGFGVGVMSRFRDETWTAQRAGIDIVILSLATETGLDVLRRVRLADGVPVLALAGRHDGTDGIAGLEAGADDYLVKPCNPRELVARLRAILRRTDPGIVACREGTLRINGIALDPAARQVTREGRAVPLTSTEFSVLERLMREAGQPVAKDVLARDALGRRYLPMQKAIDMHVGSIRRKIGRQRVSTVRGVGWCFIRHG